MTYDRLTFYKSRRLLRTEWRWRYQAAGNYEQMANNGESHRSLEDAILGACRVCDLDSAQVLTLANPGDDIRLPRNWNTDLLVAIER